jgi:hypothetical protein
MRKHPQTSLRVPSIGKISISIAFFIYFIKIIFFVSVKSSAVMR